MFGSAGSTLKMLKYWKILAKYEDKSYAKRQKSCETVSVSPYLNRNIVFR